MQDHTDKATTVAAIALLALDIDGTTIGADQKVSDANRAAIAKASAAGYKVAFITGRGEQDALAVLGGIKFDYLCAANGGIIIDAETGAVLRTLRHDADAVRTLLERVSPSVPAVGVLTDRRATGVDYVLAPHWPAEAIMELLRCGNTLCIESDLADFADHVLRVDGLSVDKGVVKSAATATVGTDLEKSTFTHRFRVTDFSSVEFLPAGAVKEEAAAFLASRLGLSMDNVVAIGDGDNDAGILSAAGLGIAMGNAGPAALAAAKAVTETVEQDGVARAIERVLDGSFKVRDSE